ncbi:MAG: TVP38/TMEM64 family protein [Synechococcales cyanobacterium K44_A2020_017]|nr:TVP38/TMEM64 family protein [Synechococcales cyanobacterium K32_A2020_035]MBF2094381.1 TVP38/TMEM64 family protein [Synechococcales cyanobacterium K44_A2020_017]
MQPKGRLVKLIIVLIGAGVGLGLVLHTPLRALLDYHALVHGLNHLGPWAVLLFIAGHILAAVLSIPGTVLVIAGGAMFGVLWGTVWSVMGATLGAIAAFWVARYLLRDSLMRRVGQHKLLTWFDRLSDRQALSCVLALRLTPISPFCLVNFLLGLTPLSLKPYAFGTLIGIIPGTLAYTWLGVTGHTALEGGSLRPFIAALVALAGLSLLPLWMQRRGSAPR